MIQHEGIIISANEVYSQVESAENSACPSCSCKHLCEQTQSREGVRVVDAINLIDAKIGDRVVIEFNSSSLIKGSLLVFLFPVICLFIGVLVGFFLADNIFMENKKETIALLTGFIFFASSSVIISYVSKKMDTGNSFYPIIKKII